MKIQNVQSLLDLKEYDFLNTNEHLKNRMMFVCLGGSHAYGTNTEESDVDLRGCAFNNPSDLLGLSVFENYVDNKTDTTIYAFNKLIHLLYACNPNIIEMLGCKPEHFYSINPAGEELVKNRKMFLSQRAVYTFGGYAFSQLRRLENAIARDKLDQSKKETHIKNSIDKVIKNFNNENRTNPITYSLSLDKAVHEGLDAETFISVDFEHYPVRDLKAFVNDINNVIRDYENDLHGRNRKKDDLHLNKHAMHLIRLYLMAIDILEKEEIITYREADHDLLMSVRNGKYQNEDGTFDASFFDMVNDLSKRMDYAKENTSLPKSPNMKRIEEFMMDINMKSLDWKI